jgi:hypothetical protein
MTSKRVVVWSAWLLALLAQPRSATADWTFGAFLGGARTQETSLTLKQPSADTNLRLSPVRYRSESLDPPLYYAGRVGFFPGSEWFGIEGELIHLKVVADTARQVRFDGVLRGETTGAVRQLSSLVQRFAITHGVNLLLVNAVARRTAGSSGTLPPRWIVIGRVGAGASLPHPESTVDGLSLERYEWGAFSAQAAAGVERRLTTRIYLSGEYKLTYTVQDVSVAAGSARTPLVTHHAVAGLVVHLRRTQVQRAGDAP